MLCNTALFAWVSKDYIYPEIVVGTELESNVQQYEAPGEEEKNDDYVAATL